MAKQDQAQSSLESAYDLLNRRAYFKMLSNVAGRVDLYNKQVEYLESSTDEKKALEYLLSLNQNRNYEEAIAFASKWKYTWFSGFSLSSFASGRTPKLAINDPQVKKEFKRQVRFARTYSGKTNSRSLLIYNILGAITFLVVVFPVTTLDYFFMAKKRTEELSTNFSLQSLLGNDLELKKPKKDIGKKVLFEDVIGIDEFKDELMEIVDYLKNPQKYEELGATVPKGILLCGNPGTGKTMLAQALANEADCSFFYKSGSEFDQIFVGSGARNIRDLFKKARKSQPAIIFIDEIDTIGGKRQMEPNNTLNQLLVEIDGFRKDDRIILIGATNLEESLDSALTRPGRFDKKITVPNPDRKGREKLFEYYLSKIPSYKKFQESIVEETENSRNQKKHMEVKEIQQKLLKSLSQDLAAITPNCTGADIQNIINLALCKSVLNREKLEKKTPFPSYENFRVVLGELRKGPHKYRGNQISQEQMRNAALYEASKAVMALFYGGKLENAGFEGGQLRLEFNSEINDQEQAMKGLEGLSFEKKNLEELIKIKMAGRVYRETFGKENDTRSIADWAKVSRVSLAYSRSLAMNGGGEGYVLDSKGEPISTKGGVHDPTLESHGNLISVQSKEKISEQMSSKIDREAVELITKSYQDVQKALKLGLRHEVELLANHLQKKEKLTVEEVKKLLGFKEKNWKEEIKKLI